MIRSGQARESVPACCSNSVLRSVRCGVLKSVCWYSSLARESDVQCCSLLQCDAVFMLQCVEVSVSEFAIV